jgi:hypothetical protein
MSREDDTMTSDLDYRVIRKRVEAGVAQEKFRRRMALLAGSTFTYLLFMVIGWAIFLSSGGAGLTVLGSDGQPDQIFLGTMIMASVAGLMPLIFQAVSLSLDTKRGEDQIRERLVAQEINREMLRMGLDDVEEQEKRKGMMRLTDDGELEEVADEPAELSEAVPLKRQR